MTHKTHRLRLSQGRALLAGLFAIATLIGFGSPASAQVSERRLGVHWDEGVPHLSFSARDLGNRNVRTKLESGLPQVIVMRVYAFEPGGTEPLAIAPRSCRVVYDLWEEVYRVQVQTDARDRTVRVSSVREVLNRCLVADGLPVGTAADYRGHRRVYFATLVELNPLSPDTVQRIRRWIARPGGGSQGDAFFGSFVSLFVNRDIGEAERTVRFRSQNVRVP